MPLHHHHKIDPSLIRSSNDIPSSSSPKDLVGHKKGLFQKKMTYDDVPADVEKRTNLAHETVQQDQKKKEHHHHHLFH